MKLESIKLEDRIEIFKNVAKFLNKYIEDDSDILSIEIYALGRIEKDDEIKCKDLISESEIIQNKNYSDQIVDICSKYFVKLNYGDKLFSSIHYIKAFAHATNYNYTKFTYYDNKKYIFENIDGSAQTRSFENSIVIDLLFRIIK